MEAKEILEKMRKEDRLLKESKVMKAVQKAMIEMGYEPLGDEVQKIFEGIENTPTASDWIPCSERLPEDGQKVLVYREDGHSSGMSVARFIKGKTKEELESMEHPRYCFGDQWGNNLRPYAWDGDGPMQWFGQYVIAWQPLPGPFKQEGAEQC